VEQVEVHAQPAEVHAVEMQTMAMKMENPEAIYPAFLSELLQANFGMAGVA
jgi:hypothetical protein